MKYTEAQALSPCKIAVYGPPGSGPWALKDIIWPADCAAPLMWITNGYKAHGHAAEKYVSSNDWSPIEEETFNYPLFTPKPDPPPNLVIREG